jgi:hypothetical protein
VEPGKNGYENEDYSIITLTYKELKITDANVP